MIPLDARFMYAVLTLNPHSINKSCVRLPLMNQQFFSNDDTTIASNISITKTELFIGFYNSLIL
jgi:hypothetical protein